MSALPNPAEEPISDLFLERMTVACRQIGVMVAQIENTVIDTAHVIDQCELPRQTLQKIDLVTQSMEELACLFERARSHPCSFVEIDVDAVIAPSRLEWLRSLVSEGKLIEETQESDDDIILF